MNRIEKAKHKSKVVAEFASIVKKNNIAKYIPVTICADVSTLGRDIEDMCKVIDIMPTVDTLSEVLAASISLYKTMRSNASFITSSMNPEQLNTFNENMAKLERANGLLRRFVRKAGCETK